MANEKKSAGGFSLSGVAWVFAALAGAYFIHEVPLHGSRPTGAAPKAYPYVGPQDVDARLWQDPLSAVARAREDARKRGDGEARRASDDAAPSNGAGAAASVPDDRRHGLRTLADEIARTRATVLGVMVQGGSYPGSIESRRRARYAVLAGLKQYGFTPTDPEHLGYVLPDERRDAQPALPRFIAYEWFDGAGGERLLTLWLDEGVFGARPIARMNRLREELRTGAQSVNPNPPLIVLGPTLSSTLHAMAREVAASSAATSGAAASNSATSNSATSNAAPSNAAPAGAAAAPPVPFYAYGATADDGHIRAGLGADGAMLPTDPAFTRATGFEVHRTIATDDQLVAALKHELAARHVDPPHRTGCTEKGAQHIVVIGEWETLFGRALPDLMDRAFDHDDGCGGRPFTFVHHVSYLRGLDGQVATSEAGTQDAQPSVDDARTAEGGFADRGALRKQIERPEGQSQVDYLRRTAMQLADSDRRWRHGGQAGIVAIGVLGSDVFDKLLALQAMHAELPNALFFTTDLDAGLLHPQEQEWARNLVVASGFGLALAPALQRDIAPFRDGYQTSLYLSTLIALSGRASKCAVDCIDERWIAGWRRARLFEIGRTTAFDFGYSPATAAPCGEGPACADVRKPACAPTDFDGVSLPARPLACVSDVNPSASPQVARTAQASFYERLLLAVFGFVSLAAATVVPSWALALWRGIKDPPSDDVRRYPQIKDLRSARTAYRMLTGGSLVDRHGAVTSESRIVRAVAERPALDAVSFVAGLVLVLLLFATARPLWSAFTGLIADRGDGEPVSFSEGISIWPTELIRLFVLVLSIAFTNLAWRKLANNGREISRRLCFEPVYDEMLKRVRTSYAGHPWKRVMRALSMLLVELDGGPRLAGLEWSAQLFWMKYLYQGRFLARFVRVSFAVVLYLAFSSLLVAQFGWPNVPGRGDVARTIDNAMLWTSVIAMQFVIFFVVDALFFASQLVRRLADDVLGDAPTRHPPEPRWARSTVAHYERRFNVDGVELDSMILMDFIALRTHVVSGLVWFPFIVIALMVFARSHFFDNWTMPLGLVIVFVVSVAIIVLGAVLLRSAAESVRGRVLERLGDDLVRAKGVDSKRIGQIETLIARARDMETGAFAPYSQQPIVRALLLPLTTFGGPALLEYLSAIGG